MNVLDLFSGIGGFSLGLERAGFRTVAFCEIEPFCRSVLEQRWPGVPVLGDIRAVGPEQIAALEPIDVICGGFPCQDISVAGRSAGLAGADSGLWIEYARVIRQVRPDWVVIENSPRLRTLGADRVLSDLEESGYAHWPIVVGAIHAGSPQIRKRAFVIAHAESDRCGSGRPGRPIASAARVQNDPHLNGTADVHSFELRQQSGRRDGPSWPETVVPPISDTWQDGPFDGEPVDDGLPEDVDAAIKAYGNSVLPQLTELIGRAIMSTCSRPYIHTESNMNYPKEVLDALERDQGITFKGGHRGRAPDGRFCYGATCTWFGSIHETTSAPGPHGGIPCCPLCRGVLFELSDESEWWGGIDAYEKEGHPGYRAMWEWQREQKKCFSARNGIDLLAAAYRAGVSASG